MIFKEEMVGKPERVTTDKEWALREVEERDKVVKVEQL